MEPAASEPWEELSKLSVVDQNAENETSVVAVQQGADEDVNGYAEVVTSG
jgi:hypothetical protein